MTATIHDLYDHHTLMIMGMLLKQHSNCIDVGAHTGTILSAIQQTCPSGEHAGFEPIPALYKGLVEKFPKVKVYDLALSDKEGSSSFHHVVNDLAYSGLKRRRYDIHDPIIEELTVRTATLDSIIEPGYCIDFIKIDVEGGELPVLRGAKNLLLRCKPTIIFESGRGSSEFYGTNGERLFEFLTEECGLEVNTLDGFLLGRDRLEKDELARIFETTYRYYFIASSPRTREQRTTLSGEYLLNLDMRVVALERSFEFMSSQLRNNESATAIDRIKELEAERNDALSVLKRSRLLKVGRMLRRLSGQIHRLHAR